MRGRPLALYDNDTRCFGPLLCVPCGSFSLRIRPNDIKHRKIDHFSFEKDLLNWLWVDNDGLTHGRLRVRSALGRIDMPGAGEYNPNPFIESKRERIPINIKMNFRDANFSETIKITHDIPPLRPFTAPFMGRPSSSLPVPGEFRRHGVRSGPFDDGDINLTSKFEAENPPLMRPHTSIPRKKIDFHSLQIMDRYLADHFYNPERAKTPGT